MRCQFGQALSSLWSFDLNDWEQRKAFIGFKTEDADLLASLRDMANEFVDDIIEDLYEQLLRFEKLRILL